MQAGVLGCWVLAGEWQGVLVGVLGCWQEVQGY